MRRNRIYISLQVGRRGLMNRAGHLRRALYYPFFGNIVIRVIAIARPGGAVSLMAKHHKLELRLKTKYMNPR